MELAKADLTALPESERNILTFAGASALWQPQSRTVYEAVTAVSPAPTMNFTAKGKAVIVPGGKRLNGFTGRPSKEAGQRRRKRACVRCAGLFRGADL